MWRWLELATPPVSPCLLRWSLGSAPSCRTRAEFLRRTPRRLLLSENPPGNHSRSADSNLCHSPWSSLRTEKGGKGGGMWASLLFPRHNKHLKKKTHTHTTKWHAYQTMRELWLPVRGEDTEQRSGEHAYWDRNCEREREGDAQRVGERRKGRIAGTPTFSCIIYAEAYTCRHPGVLTWGRREKATTVARDKERKKEMQRKEERVEDRD